MYAWARKSVNKRGNGAEHVKTRERFTLLRSVDDGVIFPPLVYRRDPGVLPTPSLWSSFTTLAGLSGSVLHNCG